MARCDPAASPPAFLGDKLRHARVAAGFRSQEALAAKLGFDRSVVAKAETGGADCVEVGNSWRKSSHSGNGGGNCVEVTSRREVLLRDSKDQDGPQLIVSAAGWRAFMGRIRGGR